MKKALLSFMILCFCGLVTAQEMNKNEFKMALGDTVVWRPFDNCDNNGYEINGPKIISFKTVKFGDCIQVIAKRVGKSSIIATCNDSEKISKPLRDRFTEIRISGETIYLYMPDAGSYVMIPQDTNAYAELMDIYQNDKLPQGVMVFR
jgi:hypothetical protein